MRDWDPQSTSAKELFFSRNASMEVLYFVKESFDLSLVDEFLILWYDGYGKQPIS